MSVSSFSKIFNLSVWFLYIFSHLSLDEGKGLESWLTVTLSNFFSGNIQYLFSRVRTLKQVILRNDTKGQVETCLRTGGISLVTQSWVLLVWCQWHSNHPVIRSQMTSTAGFRLFLLKSFHILKFSILGTVDGSFQPIRGHEGELPVVCSSWVSFKLFACVLWQHVSEIQEKLLL
jgi:hypothetical protein